MPFLGGWHLVGTVSRAGVCLAFFGFKLRDGDLDLVLTPRAHSEPLAFTMRCCFRSFMRSG